MRVTVLGSGNGGISLAFDWALFGHEVSIANVADRSSTLEPLRDSLKIKATGAVGGEIDLVYAGSDLQRAVEGAEVLIVAGPAYATEDQGRAVAPYLRPGQAIIVIPTSCAGSAAFAHAAGIDPRDYLLGETSTLPYATRMTGPASVNFFHKMDAGLLVAGYPRSSTDALADILRTVYPQIEKAQSIFQTTLQNGNPVIHPAVTLLNAARIEATEGAFDFYWDGVTTAVGRTMKAVDEERIAIGDALGVPVETEPHLGVRQGYMLAENYTTGYSTAPGFKGIRAQARLDHRYLIEDCGWSLVFFRDLARKVGLETPAMDAIIKLAGIVLDRDFDAEQNRTLATIGLGDLSVEELKAL